MVCSTVADSQMQFIFLFLFRLFLYFLVLFWLLSSWGIIFLATQTQRSFAVFCIYSFNSSQGTGGIDDYVHNPPVIMTWGKAQGYMQRIVNEVKYGKGLLKTSPLLQSSAPPPSNSPPLPSSPLPPTTLSVMWLGHELRLWGAEVIWGELLTNEEWIIDAIPVMFLLEHTLHGVMD